MSEQQQISVSAAKYLLGQQYWTFPGEEPTQGWLYVDAVWTNNSRWHGWYWVVLRNPDGEEWGFQYGKGLTEEQENSYPWDYGDGPIPLTRLYRHPAGYTYLDHPHDTS